MKRCPKHPCIGCIYFKVCGEINRTQPCAGRITKTEKKKERGKQCTTGYAKNAT